MEKRIIRVEQALRVWEDACFLVGEQLKANVHPGVKGLHAFRMFHGPLRHYQELRQHVVEKSVSGKYDYDRFTGSHEVLSLLGNPGPLSVDLFSWNHYSRKVLHLDKDLQACLSATSLDGIRWKDIHWPFKSFLVVLDDPIEDEMGSLFDHILVSNSGSFLFGKEYDTYDFLMLSTNLDEYKPIDREKYRKSFGRNKMNQGKVHNKMKRLGSDHYMSHFWFTLRGYDGEIYEQLVNTANTAEEFSKMRKKVELIGQCKIQDDEYVTYSSCNKAKHIVLSLCLYLATLPPKKSVTGNCDDNEEQKSSCAYSLASITSADRIFEISCESTLSRETQGVIAEIKKSRIGKEKRPHWRRGHWRRVDGVAKIWIRPCLINKDKLLPGSLPLASSTTIGG